MDINKIYFLRGKIRRYVDNQYPGEVSGRTYQEVLAEHNLDNLLECDIFLDGMLNRPTSDSWHEKTRLNEIEKKLEELTLT